MASATEALEAARIDPETAALLIEAASVVGRPLDATLRFKLMARARSFANEGGDKYHPAAHGTQAAPLRPRA